MTAWLWHLWTLWPWCLAAIVVAVGYGLLAHWPTPPPPDVPEDRWTDRVDPADWTTRERVKLTGLVEFPNRRRKP